jgi:hypothetical protein
MKKHISQMNSKEIKYLNQRFKSVKQSQWSFTKYSKRRSKDRSIDLAIFRSIWTDGFDLIEYHKEDKTGENRILVRSISCDKEENQVCAVVSLDTKEIITIYNNWRHNKHVNLVIEEYDSGIDVKKSIKGLS